MKKQLSIILTLVLILHLCILNVSAAEIETTVPNNSNSLYLSAKDKSDFKKIKDKDFNKNLKEGKIKKADIKRIEELMLTAVSDMYADKAAIYAELETYGSYVMNPSNDEITAFTYNGDVTVSTPTVYYNSYNNTWTVTCGGFWKNNNWMNDRVVNGYMGGQDGFGVGYTSITGTYQSSVVSASAYLNDGIVNESAPTSNRSDGDGSQGFGFRIQDYTYASGSSTYYVGKNFGGLCNYDSWFSSFGAVATGYYSHNYNGVSISSVNFGVSGKTGGVNVLFTNSSYGWTAYGFDKRFGV
jgi:hypothetical protein